MAIGEKLTPESADRWHDLGAHEDTDDTPAGARGLDALRRFFELIEAERPAWQRDALCQEPAYASVPFFPEKGENTEPAKAVCGRCLVAEECRSWAVTIDARDGIWAGESARRRTKARAA